MARAWSFLIFLARGFMSRSVIPYRGSCAPWSLGFSSLLRPQCFQFSHNGCQIQSHSSNRDGYFRQKVVQPFLSSILYRMMRSSRLKFTGWSHLMRKRLLVWLYPDFAMSSENAAIPCASGEIAKCPLATLNPMINVPWSVNIGWFQAIFGASVGKVSFTQTSTSRIRERCVSYSIFAKYSSKSSILLPNFQFLRYQ